MLSIFTAVYDFFIHFMVTELAYFSVTCICLMCLCIAFFGKGR